MQRSDYKQQPEEIAEAYEYNEGEEEEQVSVGQIMSPEGMLGPARTSQQRLMQRVSQESVPMEI